MALTEDIALECIASVSDEDTVFGLDSIADRLSALDSSLVDGVYRIHSMACDCLLVSGLAF